MEIKLIGPAFFLSQGEWMTYLASITLIQEVTMIDENGNDHRVNTLISVLILVKLLPNVFFMPLGGVLADKYDRRIVQIMLDVTCSFLVALFLSAAHFRSIPLLYLANLFQECLSGLYVPSNSAMIPMLANKSESELQKATTLNGLTWSLMAAIGSSTGGLLVASFGVNGCFVVDSVTYLTSAYLLTNHVKGRYMATEEERKQKQRTSSLTITRTSTTNGTCAANPQTPLFGSSELAASVQRNLDDDSNHYNDDDRVSEPLRTVQTSQWDMFVHGIKFAFVLSPTVGAYALLKGTAALAYGATDILNVSFSARGNEDDAQLTSFKLGALFGCVGLGCIIGSTMCDLLVTLSQPLHIVRLCLMGYCLIALGCLIMGMFPDHFGLICLSGIVRSTGSSLIWINSVLLLQKYSPPMLLGRVQSIDVASALFGEAVSALGGGLLMDNVGVSAEHLSMALAALSICFFAFWTPFLSFKTPTESY
jgi:MFS family permease